MTQKTPTRATRKTTAALTRQARPDLSKATHGLAALEGAGACFYGRISEDRLGHGYGVERQLDDGHKIAAFRGWSLVDDMIFIENDMSAKNEGTRPEFGRIVDLIEAGFIKIIIVYKIDRLTRNRVEAARLLELARRRGPGSVCIATTAGGFYDLGIAEGRLPFEMLAAAAAYENEVKAERQKFQREQARGKGLPAPGGHRPFGFQANRVDHEPLEAAAIKDGYAMVVAGQSLAAVARHWNDQGLFATSMKTAEDGETRVSRQQPWTGPRVSAVLRNARYIGKVTHQGQTTGEACWDAVVDLPVFLRVNKIISDPARSHPRAGRRLLTGVGGCAVCDLPIQSGVARGTGVARYQCPKGHASQPVAEVDEAVEAYAQGLLSLPGAPVLETEDDHSLEAMRLQVDDLRASRKAANHACYVKQAMPEDEYLEVTAAINTRIEGLLSDIQRHGVSPSGKLINALTTAEDMASLWATYSDDQKRLVIMTKVKGIKINPTGKGNYRQPFDPAKALTFV